MEMETVHRLGRRAGHAAGSAHQAVRRQAGDGRQRRDGRAGGRLARRRSNALHKKALALGGKDEGAPGPRGDGFYAGYFRDLDGNKLNAFCMSA